MAKDQAQKSGDGAKSRNHRKNQSQKLMTSQTKAILKIEHANQNKHMIKASFRDSKGNDIKVLIYTFQYGNPTELLLKKEKQLLKLGDW